MRCPDCNAHNADGATFCTLCLRRLDGPPPTDVEPGPSAGTVTGVEQPTDVEAPPREGSPAVADRTPAPPAGDGAPTPTAEGEVAPVRPTRATARSGRFRRTEEGFDWQCDRCAAWSPIELVRCRACERPFRAAMGEHDEQELPEVDATVALVLSAVAPGAGHLLLDRVGAGWARLGLFTVWVVGALVFVAQAAGTGRFPWVALPLLLGAVALSGASVVDVQRLLRRSGPPVLDGSNLLWLVVTVFGVTILAMIPTLLEASGEAPARPTGEVAEPTDEVGGS